jgi:chemotaxis signal transduction protein
MKNVIVFALGRDRFAVELRWVREVVTLGYVTPVPTAPPPIAGAVNVRGTVTPVLELPEVDSAPAKPPRRGDGALLLEVEGVSAALRVSNVETVTTLRAGSAPDRLDDGRGAEVTLLSVPTLVDGARNAVVQARAPRAGGNGDGDGDGDGDGE